MNLINTHINKNKSEILDFIAVGVGPFNLSLAALTSNIDSINCLFLDQRSGFDWHPGLMIEGVHLQTPFMSDLVTLADPTHPLSFLNYIKKQGRIYSFYIREDFFLLREEYNRYCQWAVGQMTHIRWNSRVDSINYNSEEECYEFNVVDTLRQDTMSYRAKKVVLGTGPLPYTPACCDNLSDEGANVSHSGDYLYRKSALQLQKNITVIGSGQSAAEIFYNLLQDIDQFDYTLNWVTSAPRFYPLEYTKLTLEMTSPEYVDYFYDLPSSQRKQLIASQKNLYKGINSSLINEIFDALYNKRLKMEGLGKDLKINILTNSKLEEASRQGDQIALSFYNTEQKRRFNLTTDGLVLATGFRYQEPAFLSPIKSRIRYDEDKQFAVQRNYSIDHLGYEIFVQNAELHTHGFVSPDLGMACYRNSTIIKEITGIEHYTIEERIAFQAFGISPEFEKYGEYEPDIQSIKRELA